MRRVEIGTGLHYQPVSELVAQRPSPDLAHFAARQVAQLERPVGHADQPVDLQAQRAKHLLDLAVLALPQSQREPDIAPFASRLRRYPELGK